MTWAIVRAAAPPVLRALFAALWVVEHVVLAARARREGAPTWAWTLAPWRGAARGAAGRYLLWAVAYGLAGLLR